MKSNICRKTQDRLKAELRTFSAQNQESKKQIKDMMPDLETYHEYLRCNTRHLGKLRQTLEINRLNLGKYLEAYQIPDNTIFTPIVRKANHVLRQLEYDLSYLQLITEGIAANLRLLGLKIENRRIRGQQRIERWIAALGITIGVGQIAANLRLLGLKIENRRIRGQQRIERWIAALGITIGVGQIAANVPSMWNIPQWLAQFGVMAIFAPVIFMFFGDIGHGER